MLSSPMLSSTAIAIGIGIVVAVVAAFLWLRKRPATSSPKDLDETVMQRPGRDQGASKSFEKRHTTFDTQLPNRTPEQPPPAAATDMIQWYGSLLCTQGALMGTKLPVDEAGFYIGRDREMSTLVIDDSRISRRHVWIGVKDGTVMAIEQDSTNGTFLNSIDSPRITKAELKSGDKLILGETVATFEFQGR